MLRGDCEVVLKCPRVLPESPRQYRAALLVCVQVHRAGRLPVVQGCGRFHRQRRGLNVLRGLRPGCCGRTVGRNI